MARYIINCSYQCGENWRDDQEFFTVKAAIDRALVLASLPFGPMCFVYRLPDTLLGTVGAGCDEFVPSLRPKPKKKTAKKKTTKKKSKGK